LEIDPVKVLDKARCSASPETWDIDPVSVLDSDMCSPRLVVWLNEPAKVLKNDDCFTKTETRPKELEMFFGKNLV